ncbi:hypothetical protein [Bacillus sp. UNCCL81]|uniref:hypothetical protein n=1 Tax=Bacillus sp. UNCCL81 TaxID=1502755 RepID=UPI001114204E|nr:hypothetical protein [Bacillus sp. UNCCL81]
MENLFKEEVLVNSRGQIDENKPIQLIEIPINKVFTNRDKPKSFTKSVLKRYEIEAINEKHYLYCPLCKSWLQARTFRQYHSKRTHKMLPELIYQDNLSHIIAEYRKAILVGSINISCGKLVQIEQKKSSENYSKLIDPIKFEIVERTKIIDRIGVSRDTFHSYVNALEASGWEFIKIGPYRQYNVKDFNLMIELKTLFDSGKGKNQYSKNTISLEECAEKVVLGHIRVHGGNKEKNKLEAPYSSYKKYKIKNYIPCPLCENWKSYSHFGNHAKKEHGTTTLEIFRENREKIDAMYKKRIMKTL